MSCQKLAKMNFLLEGFRRSKRIVSVKHGD